VARRARVDAELVRRGLARSRQQAAELIGAGKVSIDGMPAEIEALLGHSVFLELKVKVRPRWRRDAATLERLGL